MGGGGSQQPSTPAPPPPPAVRIDPATSAAEAALADATKQSYASSVETEDEKAKASALGKAPTSAASKPVTRRSAGTMMTPTSGSVGSSAVLTG